MRWIIILLMGSLCAAAEGDPVKELQEENKKLADRVRKLEESAIEKSVEEYLSDTDPAEGADGSNSILPEGMTLKVSGEIRVREEIRDAAYHPSDPAGARSFDFAHMRSRLRFDIGVAEDVTITIELQDVRNFGGAGSTIAITGGVDLKRGMIEFRNIFGSGASAEIGRFVMAYGDERVIGALEWFDQGRTYDGGRVRWKGEGENGWWLDFFAVRIRETVNPDDDQELVGVYGGVDWFEAYILWFHDGLGAMGEVMVDDTSFLTVGARVKRTEGRLDYTVEAIFQGGDLNGDDLTAFGAVIVVGYTLSDSDAKPRIALEIAWATGDDNPTDGDSQQLQTLFPTNHKHYGYADFVGWSNILNIRLRFTFKPSENTMVSIDYHHFQRPEEQGAWVNAGGGVIRPGAVGTSSHLGDEIDITFTIKSGKSVSFQIGYSIFIPGSFVGQTGADPTAHFGYIQVRVKF